MRQVKDPWRNPIHVTLGLLAALSLGVAPGSAAAQVAGDDCDVAHAVTVSSYTHSDTTEPRVDDYDIDSAAPNGDCGSGSPGGQRIGVGPDVVYKLRAPAGCHARVLAGPTGGAWDMSLYVLRGSCNPGGFSNWSCISLRNFGGSGAPEFTRFYAEPGITYFVVADGVGGSAGQFNIEIICDACAVDNDGDIDLSEHRLFTLSIGGPQRSPPWSVLQCRDPYLSIFDSDSDGDIDMQDFAALQRRFTGAQ